MVPTLPIEGVGEIRALRYVLYNAESRRKRASPGTGSVWDLPE
jgi:hypothetical protein